MLTDKLIDEYIVWLSYDFILCVIGGPSVVYTVHVFFLLFCVRFFIPQLKATYLLTYYCIVWVCCTYLKDISDIWYNGVCIFCELLYHDDLNKKPSCPYADYLVISD